MKNFLSVLSSSLQGGLRGGLLILVLLATTTLWAYDFKSGDLCYNITSSSEPYAVAVTSSVNKPGYDDNYSGLNTIIIPEIVTHNGKTYSVTSIGDLAFSYCSFLTSLTIPNSVTTIGNGAFSDCSSLTSFLVERSNTTYDSRNNCNAIIETATNTLIAGCKNTTIPNSVTTIGNRAFYSCSALTSITIPNSVTSIGDWAFSSCSALTSITIPNSVTSIGDRAFYDCSNIEIISIGTNVENIGSYAFQNIDNCASIYSFAAVPPTLGKYTFGYGYSSVADQLVVNTNSIEAYENDNSWNKIADRIIAIGDMYFEKSVQIDYTSASFNIRVLNYDKNEEYKVGYIWNKDTINVGMVDTIKLNLTDLFIDTDYRIIFFATKVDEPIEKGLRLSLTFRTKAIPISIDVISSTQTKMKVSLNCDSSKVAIKEQGIMMTHPNGQVDTIKFIINQTDTIIQGLTPNSEYSLVGYCIVAECNQIIKSAIKKITTKNISMNPQITTTQTTAHIILTPQYGDATPTNNIGIIFMDNSYMYDTISINGEKIDTIIGGLNPSSKYSIQIYAEIKEYGIIKDYLDFTTKDIEMGLSIIEKTQTTIQLQASLDIGDAAIEYAGIRWNDSQTISDRWYDEVVYYDGGFDLDTVICNLTPGYYYTFEVFVLLEGHEYDDKITMQKTTQTKSVYASEPRIKEVGQTYAILSVSNYYGNATLVNEMIRVNGVDIEITNRNEILVNNLNPNITYSCRSMISTVEGGTEYSDWVEFTTKPLTLATGEADGISNSSAFLHGTIDCDTMSRTEIGFEWKRSDAPSTVKPQRLLVVDRVDENLIFRLEGLSSDRYYDFRTFCLYNGKEYYGEWVGFLTSDKDILIPPSVQTREAEITDLGVLMKGFVVAGTEVILQRGFECWREESDQVATTVAEGAIMSSYIPEAWSYTTYKYRAYAKTPAGTTYGETLEVTTEYIATNIADIIVNASSNSAQVTWTMVEQADYYILTLYSDESMTEVIAVYTVDKNGNVTQKRVASATQSLVTCELTELLPETNYYFAVKAYNSADQMVAEENGAFATTQIPTSVENTHTQSPMTNCQKIIRDNQLLILRDGKTYNAMGVLVE